MSETEKVLGTGMITEAWKETKDGFFEIEIEFDDGLLDDLLEVWIDTHLHPASVSQYKSNIKNEMSVSDALRGAIINDGIIDAIILGIESKQLELDTDTDTDTEE